MFHQPISRHHGCFTDEASFPEIENPSPAENSRGICSAQEHEAEPSEFAGAKGIQQRPPIVKNATVSFRARAGGSPNRVPSIV
jgi:hypothetical protein